MPGTRAVKRQIEAGSRNKCPGCDEDVKFVAMTSTADRKQIICNIYEGEKWDRVEHWHPPCYDEAGHPYGPVEDGGFKPHLPKR